MTIHRNTPLETRHLAFIRSLPCTVCQRHGRTEAAHVRYADAAFQKPLAGTAAKPDPWWVLPLCTDCHRSQHASGERDWWQSHGFVPDAPGLSPLALCLDLWTASEQGDRDLAVVTMAQHRMNVASGQGERKPTSPPVIEPTRKRRRAPGPKGRSTLQSRPFDRTMKRKLNGRVERREEV